VNQTVSNLPALAINRSACFGAYTVVRRLSEGSTSNVFEARMESGESVALKVLREEAATSEPHVWRFYAQAKMAMLFRRPNIIDVLEISADGGRHYLAMQYHPRGSLAQHLAEHGRMPEPAAIRLTARLAEALHTVHAAGFVHRAVTPENILLTSDMQPVLSDFGRCFDRFGKYEFTSLLDATSDPAYAPPEASVPSQPVEPAFDVFALGALLCKCVTGRLPFSGRPINDSPFPRGQASCQFLNDSRLLSPPAADLLRSCIEADPADRPVSACEFALQAHSILGEELPRSWRDIPDRTQLSSPDRWYMWTTGRTGMELRQTTRSQLVRFILRGQLSGNTLVAAHLNQPFRPLQEQQVFAPLFGNVSC
jgi:serine/threonine protein kinase